MSLAAVGSLRGCGHRAPNGFLTVCVAAAGGDTVCQKTLQKKICLQGNENNDPPAKPGDHYFHDAVFILKKGFALRKNAYGEAQ